MTARATMVIGPEEIRLAGRSIPLHSAAAAAWAAAGLAVSAFVAALISQAYGWEPCELCLRQRAPYVAGLALALPALLWRLEPRQLFFGAAAVFAIGAALALYHSLVEFGVFQGLASCSASAGAPQGLSFDQFMIATENEVITDCGVRTPFFLWLSMSNWNLAVSVAIAGLFGLAGLRAARA